MDSNSSPPMCRSTHHNPLFAFNWPMKWSLSDVSFTPTAKSCRHVLYSLLPELFRLHSDRSWHSTLRSVSLLLLPLLTLFCGYLLLVCPLKERGRVWSSPRGHSGSSLPHIFILTPATTLTLLQVPARPCSWGLSGERWTDSPPFHSKALLPTLPDWAASPSPLHSGPSSSNSTLGKLYLSLTWPPPSL